MVSSAKIKKLGEKWDNTDRWVKRIIGAITALGVLIGMVSSMTGWIVSQIDTHFNEKFQNLAAQIEQLDAKSNAADLKQELSSTRNELTMLISHSPENVIQIEMVAKYYFVELGGDWYMSALYSAWAKQYGGDLSFVTHLN